MDLFGLKFSIALGAWRLRFVLMLEDVETPQANPAKTTARRLEVLRDTSRARLN